MKTFVSITLAFSGIVLITSAIPQTSAVVAQTQEDAPPLPPRRQAPPSRPERTVRSPSRPSPSFTECAPDDRKCEVERKLKGLGSDPGKGEGF
jgi:hypothetical protein